MQNTFTPKRQRLAEILTDLVAKQWAADHGIPSERNDYVQAINKIEALYSPNLGLDGILEELAVKQMESATTGSVII